MLAIVFFWKVTHVDALRMARPVTIWEKEFHIDELGNSSHNDFGMNAFRDEMDELGLQSIKIRTKTEFVESVTYQRPPVAFIHVHKTAGSLMCKLAQAHGEQIVRPSANCNEESVFVNDDYHQRAVTYRRRSHFPVPTCTARQQHMKDKFTWYSIERELQEGDICPDIFNTIGFLRHPIQRLESLINFAEHKNLHEKPEDLIMCVQQKNCNDLSFKEWEHFDNYIVRTFGGAQAMRAPPGAITEEHLKAAKGTMEKVHLMVPMECMLESNGHQDLHDKFMDLLGWDFIAGEKVNPSPHTLQFTSTQILGLEVLNKFDLQLYYEMKRMHNC